jgi:uncharacterized surface protein with fasciclin (FAS1) repeats
MNLRLVSVLAVGFALFFTVVSAGAKPPRSHDITDTIYANPILSSFAKMLQASPDIYTYLSSRGPFTVFVPTDSAFAKLPPGELDALLQPQNKERLQHILLFHIISGKRTNVKDLMPLRAIFSSEGNPLTFRLTHTGAALVLKAKITHADIHCANGNINEVDTVLMPPELALPPLKGAPVVAPASAPDATSTITPSAADTNAAPAVTNAPAVTPQ